MSETVKRETVNTPDGEVIKLDRLERCEEQLAKALAEVDHWKNVIRMLAEKGNY